MKTTTFKHDRFTYSRTVINEYKDNERGIICYCINDAEFDQVKQSLFDDTEARIMFYCFCSQNVSRISLNNTQFFNIKIREVSSDDFSCKGTWSDPCAWEFLIYIAWLIGGGKDTTKRALYHQLKRFLGDRTDAFLGDCVEKFPDTERVLNVNQGDLFILKLNQQYYISTEFDGDNGTYPIASQRLKERLDGYLSDGAFSEATKEEIGQTKKLIKQLVSIR
jgi:hypothetical protein